ncbi:trypsin-like peptidase domain-containing protein [Micromonospora parva]|uniref:trypsin-like peptidase domain-containing protein n=1 Tax=Micromonospora parva TaxID=1464048 RepID=UPI0033F9F293
MQPVGPYRFTHMLGTCPAGKAWAAIDGQGRLVTIAVLNAAVADAPGWREAFVGTANGLAQAPGGQTFAYADFSAAEPWVAYPAEAGPGAERLFRALGQDYQPVPTEGVPAAPVSGIPQQVSGVPQQVSGIPQQVSGVPQQVSGIPQQVSGVPQQVSGVPQQVSGIPQQVSGVPQQVSGVPQLTSGPPPAPWALHAGPPVAPNPNPAPTQPATDEPQPPAVGPVDAPPPHDPFAAPVRRIQPSAPPKRRTGLWVKVAALALAVAVGSGVAVWALAPDEPTDPDIPPTVGATAFPTAAAVDPPLKPWAQAAPYSPEERALAVAAPALVFVETVFTGYVRDASTNAPIRATPITFTRRCSAFVVTPDGHALTSSACVKPTQETARQIALDTVARMLVREQTLVPAQVQEYIRTNMGKTKFTGIDPGTEPGTEIHGQLNTAKGNLTTEPAIPAQVVRALPPDTGNIALIKLGRGSLPVAELNPSATLTDGSSLLIVGFATTDDDFRTATYGPKSKLVGITGTGRRGSASISRINQDLGTTSHGGIALDASGRVAGMIDQDQARPDRANRVIVPSSSLNALIGEAGTANKLGDSDKLYRKALDAYFAGQHSAAITQFDAVAQASPGNLLAKAYRQNAVERQQNESEPSDQSVWLMALLAGAGGAIFVGLIVLVVMLVRRRRDV